MSFIRSVHYRRFYNTVIVDFIPVQSITMISFFSCCSVGVAVWEDRQRIFHSRLSGTVLSRPGFCHCSSKFGLETPSHLLVISLSLSYSFLLTTKDEHFSITDLLKLSLSLSLSLAVYSVSQPVTSVS